MKKTFVAKSAGYCFGVKRAVELAYKAVGANMPVYTYGFLIHNDHVVSDLEKKGIAVIKSLDELLYLKKSKIILRSHGVAKAEYERIVNAGFEIIDATCPFVSRIHRFVEDAGADGREVIILGNARHPEVLGICGWCKTPPLIIENIDQARNLPLKPDRKYTLVAQTTFNHRDFAQIVAIFQDLSYDIISKDTVCSATRNSQEEAGQIAEKVDLMLVIGDANSSNTKKLYEICKARCLDTFYIGDASDIVMQTDGAAGLTFERLKEAQKIGVTAGASTPSEIIEEVFLLCQN